MNFVSTIISNEQHKHNMSAWLRGEITLLALVAPIQITGVSKNFQEGEGNKSKKNPLFCCFSIVKWRASKNAILKIWVLCHKFSCEGRVFACIWGRGLREFSLTNECETDGIAIVSLSHDH